MVCTFLVLGLVSVYTVVSVEVVAVVGGHYSMAYVFSGLVSTQISYVERTNGSLQMVSPSGWFNLNTDGTLQTPANRAQFVTRMHELGVRVVVCLNNHWDQSTGINALNNADNLSTQLAYYIELYDLDGINVDIENVALSQRDLYTKFVTMLREKIPETKEVSVAVGANPYGSTNGWLGSYDYASMSQYVNYFIIMAYDEHYEGGSAGSVSSISFVEKSIQYALTKTTADKIVLGIPFYGRIWSVGNTNIRGMGVTNSDIDLIVKTYNGVTTFDDETQSAKVEFTVNREDTLLTIQGQRLLAGNYVVWFENDKSIQAKMELVHQYDLKGVGAWALGQEDVTIWSNYTDWLNGSVSEPSYSDDDGQSSYYSIVYNVNGGVGVLVGDNYEAGTIVSVSGVEPTRSGYSFAGWLYNGDIYFADDTFVMPAEGIELVAQWSSPIIVSPTEFLVVFVVDSVKYAVRSVINGATVVDLPVAPVKDGYTFAGWFLDGADEQFDFDTEITCDVTLMAKWDLVSMIIMLNGVVKYQDSVVPATVSLYDGDENFVVSVETALDGSYVLSVFEGGGDGYILNVTKPGYLSYTILGLSFVVDQSVDVDLTVLGGDIDGSGYVDGSDLTLFLSAYAVGVASEKYSHTDLNGDGVVDGTDLTIFLAGYNKQNVVIINM
ncbi:MAG: glycosyl hydrolase family 18 protein [Candidatus Bathyarchaeota archaeon]|nr:glycosyl hydrolase family 18 protein [Candidatus Termiticorpusculum sp.]